jgi:hypothetical protein
MVKKVYVDKNGLILEESMNKLSPKKNDDQPKKKQI